MIAGLGVVGLHIFFKSKLRLKIKNILSDFCSIYFFFYLNIFYAIKSKTLNKKFLRAKMK